MNGPSPTRETTMVGCSRLQSATCKWNFGMVHAVPSYRRRSLGLRHRAVAVAPGHEPHGDHRRGPGQPWAQDRQAARCRPPRDGRGR
eukprot:654464-Prymnesium_polylepis.1